MFGSSAWQITYMSEVWVQVLLSRLRAEWDKTARDFASQGATSTHVDLGSVVLQSFTLEYLNLTRQKIAHCLLKGGDAEARVTRSFFKIIKMKTK